MSLYQFFNLLIMLFKKIIKNIWIKSYTNLYSKWIVIVLKKIHYSLNIIENSSLTKRQIQIIYNINNKQKKPLNITSGALL